MKSPAVVFAPVALSGCTGSPTIQPAASSKSTFDGAVFCGDEGAISTDKSDGDEYQVFRQCAAGFVSLQTVRDDAEQRMTEFCDRKGKVGHPLRERTSVPPHVLGNFPRAEIVFACITKPSTALPASTSGSDTKFARLTNPKKLLDNRVIPQQEFEVEKAKVLASP